MRNAEWTCRHWLDRPHSRFDLGTAIPHSALHIPHFPLCQSDALDATYRADLRELNELNFARFDAKLEQRLAELGAAVRTEFAQGLGQLKGDLVKWMFVFWAPTALAVVGLLLRR